MKMCGVTSNNGLASQTTRFFSRSLLKGTCLLGSVVMVMASVLLGGSAHNSAASTQRKHDNIYWRGSVTIDSGNYLNFDTKPPSPQTSNATVNYFVGQLRNVGTLPDAALFGLWNRSGFPAAAQCKEWIPTHASQNLSIHAGEKICIKTIQGRYGLLRITSADSSRMGASVSIWNK